MATLTSTSYLAGGHRLLEFADWPVENGLSSKAARAFVSGASIIEYDKEPRTLLADFFSGR